MSAPPDNAPRLDADTAADGLDSLSAPFQSSGEVDLLLDDLQPSRPGGLAPTPASATAHAAMAGRRGGAGRFALVVDHTPIARKFLALRLESLGYRVQVADSGEEALALIEDLAYAVIFLELVLAPKDDIDGLRLCQAIKRKPDHPGGRVPAVVFVTGLTGSADRVRGALAGCDAYLTKPLVKEELIMVMGEVDPLFN